MVSERTGASGQHEPGSTRKNSPRHTKPRRTAQENLIPPYGRSEFRRTREPCTGDTARPVALPRLLTRTSRCPRIAFLRRRARKSGLAHRICCRPRRIRHSRLAESAGCVEFPPLAPASWRRIPERRRQSADFPSTPECRALPRRPSSSAKFASRRPPHLDFELVVGIPAAGERCRSSSRRRSESKIRSSSPAGANVGRDASSAVAGNLRRGTVGIDHERISTSVGKVRPLHSTPSAPTPSCRSQMRRVKAAISGGHRAPSINQEIVAAGAGLDERNGADPAGSLRVPPGPGGTTLRARRAFSSCGSSPSARGCSLRHQTANGHAGRCRR